jgi:hypothetical protein
MIDPSAPLRFARPKRGLADRAGNETGTVRQ